MLYIYMKSEHRLGFITEFFVILQEETQLATQKPKKGQALRSGASS